MYSGNLTGMARIPIGDDDGMIRLLPTSEVCGDRIYSTLAEKFSHGTAAATSISVRDDESVRRNLVHASLNLVFCNVKSAGDVSLFIFFIIPHVDDRNLFTRFETPLQLLRGNH